MSPKHFNLLEDEQKEIITSVYSEHLLSIGVLRSEYSVFMTNVENVYEKAKNSPHSAVDYLHSITDNLLRRRMIESYRSMLISLIDTLRNASHKNIALVFKRALDILQDDFSKELTIPIEDLVITTETEAVNKEIIDETPTGIIRIEEGLTEIGECAYSNNENISSLVIPASITTIHRRAFVNFYGSYVVNIANKKYSSSDGILYNKDKSVLLRVPVKVGFDAYTTATAVKTIGRYAFQGLLHLIFIDIGDNVERIEDLAFCENLDLEELHIASNVIYIGHRFLFGCENLHIIYCDIVDFDKLTIENDAFDGIDLSKVTLIVPPSMLDKYKQHPIWGKFVNIIANANILEEKPEPEIPTYTPTYTHYGGGGYGGWGTYHGYQSVSGHWRSGHYRNGHWVSGHYVRSHGRWR